MAEKIDPTWLAYSLARPAPAGRIEAGLERVKAHYGNLVSYPLSVRALGGERLGVAVVADSEPTTTWPQFVASNGLALAAAYPPSGWERLTGEVPSESAALRLARVLLEGPETAVSSLTGPMVLAALDEPGGRLVVVNDCIGAGRLYETRLDQGFVWSNRAAAGHLFAGLPIAADTGGWLSLAAVGWFFGDATPITGVRKVPRGTVIQAGGEGTVQRQTTAVGELVNGTGPQGTLDDLFDAAADAAVDQVRLADSLWASRPVIHLSGGRDSRLVAAAAVHARVDAVFRTGDGWPGEADIARRLVELSPRPMEHVVVRDDEESAGPESALMERALRVQLLHDGMRQASKIRFDVALPRERPDRATMAGWGGEIAHAFYYQDSRQLRKVRWGGRRAVLRRLLESSRRKHNAAHDAAYELARSSFEERIREGRDHGLKGPDLLDWFYLTERFVNRFEVGADSQSVSVYTTPAFIRAAFATTPEQRLQAYAHRAIIPRLVPAWGEVPFYRRAAGPRPSVRRRRLWEAEGDARAVEEMIAGRGPWTDMFRPDRITGMWSELRSGGGFADWETVLERIVCRVAFDCFLAAVNERSTQGPPLFDNPA